MNTCNVCGYKVISNSVFEKHKASHGELPEVASAVVEEATASVVAPAPIEEEPIVLRFSRPVEFWTNGTPFISNEKNEIVIKGKNAMAIAADLTRRAREAYGREILA